MNALMERAFELWRAVDEFGPLHIIVSDGNIDDCHIEMCEKNRYDERELTDDERELLALLKAMTIDARESLWDRDNNR